MAVLRVNAPIATPARIELVAVFVSHLPTRLSTSVLAPLGEALIQIRPDDALIELGAANVLHTVEGVLVAVVLDEAEPARRLLEAVKTHDQPLDLTTSVEFVSHCVETEGRCWTRLTC
jgi:hypothetical protein